MLTIREFLSGVKEDYSIDSTPETLLRYLDRLQRDVFHSAETTNRVWLNTAEPKFPYPILTTTPGQLFYEITADSFQDSGGDPITVNGTIRSIKRVFTWARDFYASNYGEYNQRGRGFYDTRFRTFGLQGYGNQFVQIPCKKVDRINEFSPNIQFTTDYDVTNRKVYVEFTTDPTRITSLNSTAYFDIATFEEELTDGLVGQIELARDGSSQRWNNWVSRWKGVMRSYYSRNDDEFYDMEIESTI